MQDMTALTRETILERAHVLADEIAQRSLEIDKGSELPEDIIAKAVDAGIMAMLTPKVYGGPELGLDVLGEVIRPIAGASLSAAWVIAFLVAHNVGHCQFSEECQQEIFSNGPSPTGAGAIAPKIRLTPVDGGYLGSGRSPFCSAVAQADWMLLGGVVVGDEAAGPMVFLVPSSDLHILKDSWDVMGMRATGSYDVELDKVFIPEHRLQSLADFSKGRTEGSSIHPNPMYQTPFHYGSFIYLGNIFTGATRGVLTEYMRALNARRGNFDGAKIAAKPLAHWHAGRGEARTALAQAMVDDFTTMITAPGYAVTDEIGLQGLLAQSATIVQYCRDTVNELVLSSGANAFRNTSRLQMFFRDINMASTHHAWDAATQSEELGRMMLEAASAQA